MVARTTHDSGLPVGLPGRHGLVRAYPGGVARVIARCRRHRPRRRQPRRGRRRPPCVDAIASSRLRTALAGAGGAALTIGPNAAHRACRARAARRRRWSANRPTPPVSSGCSAGARGRAERCGCHAVGAPARIGRNVRASDRRRCRWRGRSRACCAARRHEPAARRTPRDAPGTAPVRSERWRADTRAPDADAASPRRLEVDRARPSR